MREWEVTLRLDFWIYHLIRQSAKPLQVYFLSTILYFHVSGFLVLDKLTVSTFSSGVRGGLLSAFSSGGQCLKYEPKLYDGRKIPRFNLRHFEKLFSRVLTI